MNSNERIEIYKESWESFRKYCEKKAELADCYINNKGWHKLREFHLENFLKDVSSPYGFLFVVRFRHNYLYKQVKCMPKIYYKYAKKHREQFDSPGQKMVTYPSWRGIFGRKE